MLRLQKKKNKQEIPVINDGKEFSAKNILKHCSYVVGDAINHKANFHFSKCILSKNLKGNSMHFQILYGGTSLKYNYRVSIKFWNSVFLTVL